MDKSAEYHRRICRAMDFISTHLNENPTVQQIADAAPFSSFHFQRLFRALVGESVAEFTRRVRLETAARYLLFRPSEEITEIAIELGYSSSQNFAKAFKLHFQLTPTEYRQQMYRAGGFPTDLNAESGNDFAIRSAPSLSDSLAVTVRELPATRVVYQRHFGSYADSGVQAAFDELQKWALARKLDRAGAYLGIPWDDSDITMEGRCRFDACLVVAADEWVGVTANTQVIPAGPYAIFRCQVTNHDFETPWSQLMREWLPKSGYQPGAGPRFERYLSDGSRDPDGCWELDIGLPVIPL